LLGAVIERQAALIAQWQSVGFIHGVMNTDNMAISGETIDYGPCAFMDVYHPATVFSSIDHRGRYAYENQPRIAQWNLARFCEALLPLLDEDAGRALDIGNETIEGFQVCFQREWLRRMRAKLGLFSEEAGDRELVESLLEWMQETHADFTNTFRDLSFAETAEKTLTWHLEWRQKWHARLGRQVQSLSEVAVLMRASNPAYIPRNHKVEEALAAASDSGDFSVMQRLLEVLARPYEATADDLEYRVPPPPSVRPYQTFCGT
jgi:serine/tyrosine/threonine adenylyltransferase